MRVKLGDESGAAGIAFASDGAEKHYGFYPTNGALRLTRFDGPDGFSWSILAEVRPTNYRAGEWNDLRVKVEPDKLTCFLNGEMVINFEETCPSGQAGLCTFRESTPEFRLFRLGRDLPAVGVTGQAALLREADQLETRAQRLRDEAAVLHEEAVERDLLAAVTRETEQEIDLVQAALVIAQLDDPDLDVTSYRERVTRLGEEFRASLGPDAAALDPATALERLNQFFFHENGFHGARFDYENLANSRLSEALDDREGIPILLCLLYIEIGRAGGLDLVGLPRPLQFVVGLRQPGQERPLVIDVFEGGGVVDEPETADLKPASKRAMLTRMLTNLRTFSASTGHRAAALSYASLLVALNPDEIRTRLTRAALALDQKRPKLAAADLARLDAQTLDAEETAVARTLRSALPDGRSAIAQSGWSVLQIELYSRCVFLRRVQWLFFRLHPSFWWLMNPTTTLRLARAGFVLFACLLGVALAPAFQALWWKGALVGAGLGLVVAGLDVLLIRFTIGVFSSATFGLMIGLFCAWLITRINFTDCQSSSFQTRPSRRDGTISSRSLSTARSGSLGSRWLCGRTARNSRS